MSLQKEPLPEEGELVLNQACILMPVYCQIQCFAAGNRAPVLCCACCAWLSPCCAVLCMLSMLVPVLCFAAQYCECFDAGVPCSSACRCEECQNQGGPSAGDGGRTSHGGNTLMLGGMDMLMDTQGKRELLLTRHSLCLCLYLGFICLSRANSSMYAAETGCGDVESGCTVCVCVHAVAFSLQPC